MWRWPPFNVALVLPAQLSVLFVVAAPTVMVVWLSLTDWQPTQGVPWYEGAFYWLWNFYDLYYDSRFIEALIRTVALVAVCVGAELAIAFALVPLFLEEFWGKKLAVSALVLPMMIVPVDAANAFFMLFNETGPINHLIGLMLGRPFWFAWLGDPNWALLPIALAEIWQWTPLMFLLVLTGFLNAPQNQFRAAISLGASPASAFLRILLPLTLPVIGMAVLIRTIETFKIFDIVYILTRGGPGTSTETISMFMFNGAFVYFRMAYVAAAALLVLLLVISVCLLFIKKILAAEEHRA